jgi:hypothetical protein
MNKKAEAIRKLQEFYEVFPESTVLPELIDKIKKS